MNPVIDTTGKTQPESAVPSQPLSTRRHGLQHLVTTLWPWLAVWLLALAVRLVYVWQIRGSDLANVLLGDAVAYDAWARELAGGNWLGGEVYYQAPLYPHFLGVLYTLGGESLAWVRGVQIVLGATTCLLLALTGKRLFGSSVGLLAGVLLAINPAAVYFDALMQKTVLDGFLFVLLLWTLSHWADGVRAWGWLLGAGISLGLLVLTRENALLLTPVILVWFWLSDDRVWNMRARVSLAFVLGMSAMLLPVVLRNLNVGGEFHLTTSQFGPNFYIGNHAGASGLYEPLRFGRGRPGAERTDATQLAAAALGRKLSTGEVSRYWFNQSLAYMQAQPADWLRLTARKWMLVWNAVELGDSEDIYSFGEQSSLLRTLTRLLHFGVVAPLGVLGIVLWWPERRRLWWLLAIVLIYALSVTMFFVFARYRYPLVPAMTLFAAAGIVRLIELAGAGNWRTLGVGVAVACLAIVGRNWPVISADSQKVQTRFNMGLDAAGKKDNARAIAYYAAALELHPEFESAHNNLGALLLTQGKTEDALEHLRTAIRLKDDVAESHHNLANALLAAGKPDAAEAEYAIALKLEPNNAQAHYNLANLLAAQGKSAKAKQHYNDALRLQRGFAAAYVNLGNLLLAENDLLTAGRHFKQALEIDPRLAVAHNNLGSILFQQQELPDAVREYREAIDAQPDYAEAHLNLGLALIQQGELADANKHLREAARLNPNFAEQVRGYLLQIERVEAGGQ